ncbi:MAG: Epsin-3, clathrin recruitment and traffic between the Golgi and endosome [Pycnora praestabilis]|nr:MAG: Epsin-3, clathrin recruitment and traffic between the Golgi and endosome [Pycnora praestabilis]
MDFNTIKDQVSNLTLYDLKAGVRKVQNAVMNYTPMEAKVREATNNEPWGASSTMQQEIANGTYNYQLLNEIMPMIYKRFTEKSAEEWRQIYKGLQLLEFLVKNGSERVIDDARSHLSLLKMLRQFHFIDENGKDQGLNVRNRAKELADLLSDVERIRAERKKARATRNKYGGVEGGMGLGAGMSSGSGSRYGGFGSEEASGYGGYSGGVYGDGGGFGGASDGFQDTGASGTRRDRFDEYDEYDEGAVAAPGRRKTDAPSVPSARREIKKSDPPKKKEPEVDLFSFGDDDPPMAPVPPPASNGKQSVTSVLDDGFSALQTAGGEEDDFDDFQSATPSTQAAPKPSFQSLPPPTSNSSHSSATRFAAPQPVSASKGANLTDLVGFASISPALSSTATPTNASAFSPPPLVQQQLRPTGYQATQPNYFTSVSVPSTQALPGSAVATTPGVTSPGANKSAVSGKPASSSGDAFGSLWSSASAGIKKSSTPSQQGSNLAAMAKEKASAGIWGSGPGVGQQNQRQTSSQQGGQKVGVGLDDLLG